MGLIVSFFASLNMRLLYRIIISGICGILIGWERKNRSKEAGIRTHCVVACTAALMMIVSKYGFFDLITSELFAGADIRLDPSRVAQGIVTGISFLGAGMIFVNKNVVKGLTTAAGIWATSGIGMAIGSGLYFIGIAMTVMLLTLQTFLHGGRFSRHNTKVAILHVYGVDNTHEKYIDDILGELKKLHITVNSINLKKKDGAISNYYFNLEIPDEVREDAIVALINYDCEISG